MLNLKKKVALIHLNQISNFLSCYNRAKSNEFTKQPSLQAAEKINRVINIEMEEKEKEPFQPGEIADFRITTCPKSGTHLLYKLLNLMGLCKFDKTNSINGIQEGFRGAHLSPIEYQRGEFSLKELKIEDPEDFFKIDKNLKYIVGYRDIRDTLLSLDKWLDIKNRYPKKMPFYSRLLGLIKMENMGISQIWFPYNYKIATALYKNKSSYPNILFVKFEDIVGSKMGGTREKQLQSILKIAEFINYPMDIEKLNYFSQNLYGDTLTFAKGRKKQIGDWKNVYSIEHIKAVKENWNDFLLTFGYETDPNWDEKYIKELRQKEADLEKVS